MKLNEAFAKTLKGTEKKRRDTITAQKNKEKDEEVEERFPGIRSMAAFVVAPQYHEAIKNFVEDMNLGEAPDNDNMLINVYASEGYNDLDEIEVDSGTKYFVDKFTIEVIEPKDSAEQEILVASGVCPPMSDLIAKTVQKYGESENTAWKDDGTEDVPSIRFVVSARLPEGKGKELNQDPSKMSKLQMLFNEYVPFLSTRTLTKIHLASDQMDLVQDGRDPNRTDLTS